jgi:hypothetical protein
MLKINWDKQPLGKMPDIKLAEKLGCGWRTVYRQRHRRSIPAWQPHRSLDIPLEVLGTASDEEIAERYNTYSMRILKLRKRHGVPAFIERTGHPPPKPLPKALLNQLGKKSDIKLAREFGLHFSQIYYYRTERKIPAVNEKDRARYLSRHDLRTLLELRLAPDKIIARVLGISASRISEIRNKFSIPAFGYRERCPCGKRSVGKGRFCSYECDMATALGRIACKIRLPPGFTRHHQELDGICWALGQLNKTICRISGNTTNRTYKRKARHGTQSKTKADRYRARSKKNRHRGRRTGRKAT